MKTELEIKHPDYKEIKKKSSRIDCTIREADFNTSYPNENRISYIASDINRYLKYNGGGRI